MDCLRCRTSEVIASLRRSNPFFLFSLSIIHFLVACSDFFEPVESTPEPTEYSYNYGLLQRTYLFEDELRTNGYIYNEDANGRYVINREKRDDDDVEADYMWVHWILPANQWLDGGVYIVGDVFGNALSPQTRMQYDEKHGAYTFSAYLKQGGYEWLYLFYNTRAGAGASSERVEGSYWQTRNAYRLMYYYRGLSDRYTRLLCVENIENALIVN